MEFKACPRCQGDLHATRDMYGEYKWCLQCGYSLDVQRSNKVNHAIAVMRGKAGRPRKAGRRRQAA